MGVGLERAVSRKLLCGREGGVWRCRQVAVPRLMMVDGGLMRREESVMRA